MRENNGPAIANVVVKNDISVGALAFKVGDSVSDGEVWHLLLMLLY